MSDNAPAAPRPNSFYAKKIICAIFTVIVYLIISNIPAPAGLEPVAMRAFALIICAVLTWVFETIPLGVASLFFVIIQPLPFINTVKFPVATTNFFPGTVFFVIACFLLAQGLIESGLGVRAVHWLTAKAGGRPKLLLFYLMMFAGLISFVIADLAVAAMLAPICMGILKENNLEPMKTNYGKAMMIGLPLSVFAGGAATPAGALFNFQAMDLMAKVANTNVSFVEWMTMGVPIAIILIPIMYLLMILIFPPEIKHLVGAEKAHDAYTAMGGIKTSEIKFLVVLVLLIISWFTTKLPLPVSGLIAACLLFMPGINVMNAQSFGKAINWNVILLVCASTGLGMGVWQTGGAEWLGKQVLSATTGMSPLWVIAVVSAFTVVVHLIIPMNPAIIAIMVPSLVVVAQGMGISPAALVLPLAFTTSAAFLLPLDSVALVTYSTGYYTFGDYFKGGVLPSIAWVIVTTIVLAVVGPMLGYF